MSVPAYGVDTEFHRERTYYPHLALVQLSWTGGLALVDPLSVDVGPLSKVFAGEGLALAHAAEQDLEVLERACGVTPSRLFDTQLAAGFVGLSNPSLATLVDKLLGVHLTKGDRLSDWTARPLSAAQREYAASDVAHLLDLHKVLVDRLVEMGRLEWAEEECALMLARSRRPQVPEEAWWRVKEARHLRGRARAVAQEVAAWREREAMSSDRPARFVLSDLALVAIAQHPPERGADMARIRGLENRHLRTDLVEGLLSAVASGRDLPDGRLRTPPVETPERAMRPAATLVGAWVTQRAAELQLGSALLGTRADVGAFLRGDPRARLAKGWRRTLVGEDLERLVAGKAALAMDQRGGRLVIESREPE